LVSLTLTMKPIISALILCAACAARAAIVLSDTFTYPDGALTNASPGKWRHTSGGMDEVNVTNATVELTRSETEDVEASLGVSYSASSGTTLYARFSLHVLAPPAGANGNYFAHFAGSSTRARVFVVTNGAAAGHFRLGIANGSTTASAIWPVDLNTNQTYSVVTRLVVSNAQATLWINPASGSDTSIAAADVVSPSSANAFAWRQDTGMGILAVDDLVVATGFDEATSGNETPSISDLPDQQLAEGGTTAIPFAIGDAETAASDLTLLAQVSLANAVLVSFGGDGSNRTVTVTGNPGQTNGIIVTVLVTDGTTTNSDAFVLTIVPALLFSDDFNYSNGSLATNGAPPWVHHSGSNGEMQVVSGRIVLSTAQTEDVNLTLPGGPFAASSGVMLYASFLVNFSQRPGSSGDYFAHFNTTGARCRLFANTANAAPGRFRLGLANAAGSVSEQLATDLSTNTIHRVVLRYDPASATSRLWVNPLVESDDGTNATDVATPTSISSFAFREDPGIGTLTVDDLRIGLTFAAVAAPAAPVLRIHRLPDGLRIAWAASAAGFILQTNSDLASTNWQNVGAAPPDVMDGENRITNSPASANIFFRLKRNNPF
jgi:hypothetical protein